MNQKSIGFWSGVRFLGLGWSRILLSPKLILLSLIPFTIAVLFLFIFVWYAVGWIDPATRHVVSWMLTDPTSIWGQMSSYFLYALFAVSFFVLAVYMTYVVAILLSAPFYTMLAEAVIYAVDPEGLPRPTLIGWFKSAVSMVVASCIKAVVFGILGIFIFLMALIPGLNFVSIVFALLVVAFDAADYSFEARGWTFRKRMQFFFDHPLVFCGMGLILALPMLIPGGILLVMPGAVVGAALHTSTILKGRP